MKRTQKCPEILKIVLIIISMHIMLSGLKVHAGQDRLATKSTFCTTDSIKTESSNDIGLLNLSREPAIAAVWNNQVEVHTKLFEFAVNLARLTAKYGTFPKFPAEEIKHLISIFDFSKIDWKKNSKLMRYILGFIAFNRMESTIFNQEVQSDITFTHTYELNLVLITALIISKIEIRELNMREMDSVIKDGKFASSSVTDPLFLASHKSYQETQLDNIFYYSMRYQKRIPEKKREVFYEYGKVVFTKWARNLLVPFYEIAGNSFWGTKNARSKIVILPEYKNAFPKEFREKEFDKYFYSLPDIERTTQEMKYFHDRQLFGQYFTLDHSNILLPGDRLYKVKTIKEDFYIKRIDIIRSNYPEEEIVLSKEIEKVLKQKHPEIQAQEFVGIVYNKGSFYLISKKAPGKAYNFVWEEDINYFYNTYLPDIIKVLEIFGIEDSEGDHLRERECSIGIQEGKVKITIIDFETFPFKEFTEEELRNRDILNASLKNKHNPIMPEQNKIMTPVQSQLINNKA